jgi:predicted DNA binding CopG/RHH family protein
MNNQIYLIVLCLALVTIIPTASAQLSLGEEANQKLIEVKLDKSEIVNVKHVIDDSGMPVNVKLFDGVITESIIVSNENGDKTEFGLLNDSQGNISLTIFPSKSNTIIKYNLEDSSTFYENLWTVRIGYSETFSILFSEGIDLFFLNDSIIPLENKSGISVNGGGNARIQYYDKIPKITQEVKQIEDKFNIEIITNSKIDKFNFDEESKSISFQVNEKKKFVTVTVKEELLGSPYVILLNDQKIKYTKSVSKENYVSLSMKPQVAGEIVIIGSEYIDGLTKITSNDTLPIESESNDTLPIESESISNDYFIWLVLGGILIIVVIVVIVIMRKIKK